MKSVYTYSPSFYDSQHANSFMSARQVVPFLIELIQPRSVVDLGCGLGTWLSVFRENGIEQIAGFDGSYVQSDQLYIPKECFHAVDLEDFVQDATLFSSADLAMSLEVAEHLTPEGGDRLVKTLVSFASVVVFSAAIPRQGGMYHINEQWPEYWHNRFREHGYQPLDVLRPIIWENASVEPWYRQNMYLYVAPDKALCHTALPHSAPPITDFKVVHPGVYSQALDEAGIDRFSGRELLREAMRKLLARISGFALV